MKLRSGRTTVAAPPSDGGGDGEGEGECMNASLWGELQCFVDLSLIYVKLPLAPFFRLRQVCKEWNRLASDRQFLERHFKPPISNLYFVVARRTGHRLWTSQDSSSWTSSPLPRRRCDVSGLLYEDSDRHRVFDVHTRVFYSLPPLPSGKLTDSRCIVGMTVDTTRIPYGFSVFITEGFGTSTYDSSSGAWTTPTPTCTKVVGAAIPFTLSSVHYKKFLNMLTEKFLREYFDIETYDLEKRVSGYDLFHFVGSSGEWEYCGIGMWFEMKPKSFLAAWQMNTHFDTTWTVPKDLRKWMMRGSGHRNFLITFCGEHVLGYNCLETEERAVLYNLDRKTWDKIEVFAKKKARVPK